MTNTQTLSVRLDVPFTDVDIDLHIMGSGFNVYEWWTYIDDGLDGYAIEADDPNSDEILSKTVTYDDIRRAMSKICEYRPSAWDDVTIRIQGQALPSGNAHAPLAKQQIMDGIRTGDFDIDADGADEIMQVAVFGEVVYS